MTKIAYLTSQYPATSHTFIRREVEALRKAGVDIATFSIRPPSISERSDPENREAFQSTTYIMPPRLCHAIRAHIACLLWHPLRYVRTLVDALRHRAPGISATIYSFIYFAEAIVLADALRKQRITHLHNHFANASAIVGFLATRFLGIEFSLTLHGISEFEYPAGLLLRKKLEHAKFVACASHFCRAQAQRITDPSTWQKLKIVRCGIDTTRFSKTDEPRHDTRLRVLHIGRLSAEKGQAGLISAFDAFRQSGADAELRIIGDGPLEATLKELVRDRGLDGHCIFLGRQGEEGVITELRTADMFVMSSFMEGLPVVLMEAMACGVPVIAPCVAGIPELVQHGKTGLTFSPGDWDDLVKNLRLLHSQPAERRQIALAGRALALELHDIEKTVHPLISCFGQRQEAQFPEAPRQES